MQYVSTRNLYKSTTLSKALTQGMPEDGGLYVPVSIPKIELKTLDLHFEYSSFANSVLQKYFNEDHLATSLNSICKNAFNFPVPLTTLNSNTYILELFHGPTASFKDFGARFLAECLNTLSQQHKTTIIVATSGDTGSAVAAAFYQKSNINVIILYPRGKISSRQEHQITCWGENILALAIDGNFDDCQHIVKSAFTDDWWRKHFILSTANSINIGRLLPQICYYAFISSKFYNDHHTQAGFIVPSGNLGNVTAAYFAKEMGFPIREIVIATNANRVVSDFIESGKFQPRISIQTLANAMDVGNPNNFQRLQYLFETFAEFKKNVTAFSVTDEQIQKTIIDIYKKYQTVVCPHTATACWVREQLSDEPWIVVATADPCKFEKVIEPLLHQEIPPSPALQALLSRPQHYHETANDLHAVASAALEYFMSDAK